MTYPVSASRWIVLTLAVAFVSTAAAAPKPLKPKVWIDMDYGPFMSLTLESPKPQGNIAYKGIVVPLKPDRSAAMVFDTDLLRWSAGWNGEFIDWRNILFDGSHGTHCRIKGEQVFGTAKLPGWAKPGTEDFADPREFPHGPMPRDWMRWKGLYRDREHVILSYDVGGVAVLESAGLLEREGPTMFTRRLSVAPRKQRLLATISDTPGTLVELAGRGAELVRDGDRVRLSIPAGDEPVELKLFIAAGTDVGAKLKEVAADANAAAAGADVTLPRNSLVKHTDGGPARHKPIVTKIHRGDAKPDAAFAVDTLTLPADNPWKAQIRPGGLDFFQDGKRAAVCTWDGDVWIVDGLAGSGSGGGDELTWTRFATGLFQPLGLAIRDDAIYVLGRDQITRLHDLNADGEADWYEAFNHDAQVTEHFHEFAMDLQISPKDGDFYYMKGACHAKAATVPQQGTLMRVAADGGKSEIVCWGFRAPNGLAIGKDGKFFTTDQQGHWTPANRVNLIEPGKYYGYGLSYLPKEKPAEYEPPVTWVHPKFDRSPAQPFFVDSDKWGPLSGKLLMSSYGTGELELVMTETIEGKTQGGVVKLNLPQATTGIMRSRFSPADGQLYVCGLFGWAGNQTAPGGLYRVRYTGQPLRSPIDLRATKSGVVITFSEPLDKELAADVESYGVARWNYTRTAGYGSPDKKVSDGTAGQDPMTVTAARVSKDGRTVELDIKDMRPAMQMQIQYNLEDEKGGRVRGEIQSTVHVLGDAAGR